MKRSELPSTILIVDDHDVIRQGIRSLLSAHSDWEVVGEAGNSQQALAAVAVTKPDVVILDITMPGTSGLETAPQMLRMHPGIRILIFTMHESRRIAEDIRQAGAHGYVQKSQAARDLIIAVERLLAGGTFFGPHASVEGARPEREPKTNPGLRYCWAVV